MQKRHVLSALCAALACSALTLLSGCERQAAEVKQPSKEGAKVEAAQPPKESAKTEVNPHPIANVRLDKEGWALHFTVNGEGASISFAKEREALPEFVADFALADVTGDGVDELLVRVFIVGNTASEMRSDGHVYEVKDGELKEALSIPADGFGRWKPEFPNNDGICPGPGGTLGIDAAANKEDGALEGKSFLLVRQGGAWTVKDAPEGFACSDAEEPGTQTAPLMTLRQCEDIGDYKRALVLTAERELSVREGEIDTESNAEGPVFKEVKRQTLKAGQSYRLVTGIPETMPFVQLCADAGLGREKCWEPLWSEEDDAGGFPEMADGFQLAPELRQDWISGWLGRYQGKEGSGKTHVVTLRRGYCAPAAWVETGDGAFLGTFTGDRNQVDVYRVDVNDGHKPTEKLFTLKKAGGTITTEWAGLKPAGAGSAFFAPADEE
ncbi:MAG: hypothetical protein IJR28_07455 [Ottowia sp.]|nr:hypothetical protein [Ottowia sp.]